MDRLTRQHIKAIEQQEKTPRTEAAFAAYIHDASLDRLRKEMRKLETELAAERHCRKNFAHVCKDALEARDRAEADRNAAWAERDQLRTELNELKTRASRSLSSI